VRFRWRDAFAVVAFPIVFIAFWQAWVTWRHSEPYILPAPTRIWSAFMHTRGTLPGHIETTLWESFVGLVIGAAIGVVFAIAIVAIPFLRRVLWPSLVASQTIPMIVLAPLLVLWFGIGTTPKIIVVALIVFFPVTVSTANGLATVDDDMVDLVRTMGANRWDTMRLVRIPAAIPAFFSGLRISAAYAIAGAVVGEWVGASRGLGIYIDQSKASFRVDQVFVAVVIIALLSMALFGLVNLGARLAAPWMYAKERSTT
jgi:putative hydroxymethylpyrimidine transport system permease protein